MIDDSLTRKLPDGTRTGSRYRPVYTPELKDGHITLVQSGVEDFQNYIDSFKDEFDVNLLAQRFLNGDATAFDKSNPVFMDVTKAPKTLAEAYALNFRAEAAFNGLPVDIKEKFDNSYFNFISEAGSAGWYEKLTIPNSDQKESDVQHEE